MTQKQELPLGLFAFSLLFSLLLHGLLFFISQHSFHHISDVTPPLSKDVVEWIDLSKSFPDRQIVDVIDQKSLTDKTVDSPYLSDENRKVTTSSVAPGTSGPTMTKPSQADATSLDQNKLNLSDQKLSQVLAQTQTPFTISVNPNNYLPEIQVGNETMLSTQKFAYASYFTRMKQAIEVYWKPPASLVAHNPYKKTWITTLLIVLDDEGKLNENLITTSSGVTELDQFALRAVSKAAPFYNPPEVLLDESGEIRMTWNFIFEASRF